MPVLPNPSLEKGSSLGKIEKSFLKVFFKSPCMDTGMNRMITRSLLFMGLAMSQAVAADGDLPDHKLSEFGLGTHLFGEEVTMESLKGRVVVIEKWGVR